LFARVDIGVTDFDFGFSDKNSRKRRKTNFWVCDFFSKVGVRIPFSVGNFHFLAAKK
jgi:hypothetical protein